MTRPPKVAEGLLRAALGTGIAGRSVLGDLHEEFEQRAATDERAARSWYRREAVGVAWRALRDRIVKRTSRAAHPAQGGGDLMLHRTVRELRLAARALLRAPGFTAVAMVTLALGIGANTAIFSVVNGVLLQPLPYADADRLVALRSTAPGLGYDDFNVSPGIYYQYLEENQAFSDMGLYRSLQATVTGDGPPERIPGAAISRSLLPTLGVSPLLGRNFSADEDAPDGPGVVLLGHGLWQTRFAGDPGILGRTLTVNGTPREIVGVMPEGFAFPADETRLWLPTALDPDAGAAGQFSYDAVARLRAGLEPGDVVPQLAAIVKRLRDRAEANADGGSLVAFLDRGQYAPLVVPLKERLVGDLSTPLLILLGTVGFILLIACANVANLFLVRAESRQREMAVRAAMGAGRGELVRQFLSEGLVLAAAGGAVGLVVAAAGVPVLLRMGPDGLPRANEVGIDGTVLAFTGLVTLAAVLLCAAIPVVRYTSPRMLGVLKQGGRGSTAGRERHLARAALVVAQTALALTLLVGSGLLVRSFVEIRSLDPGFTAEDVLTFRVTLPDSDYPGPLEKAAFHHELIDRLESLPGVVSAGAVQSLPIGQGISGTAFEVEDFPTPQGDLPPMVWGSLVGPGFFESMEIPVVAGRTIERRDAEDARASTVVSEPFARKYWGRADVVGKRLRYAGDSIWFDIVGVVGGVRHQGLREQPTETVYMPMVGPRGGTGGTSAPGMTYTIRALNAEGLAGPARAQVWEMDPDLPVVAMQTMEQVVADSIVRLSFTATALGVAAGLALVLGAVGLYGVLSYVVTQRTPEIGVRMALGAEAGVVRRMVVGSGVRIAAVGLAVGLLAAGVLTRVLQSLLYGTEALDPLVFAAAPAALMAVVLLASWIPARRASAVDPVRSMKTE